MGINPCFDDLIAWLLKAETPSIRFLTRKSISKSDPKSSELVSTQAEIASSEPVLSILKAQHPDGFWITDRNFYSPKYRSSHWSMLLLTELAIDPQHPKFQSGAAYMLERVFQNPKRENWLFQNGVGCFWGNWLRYQLHAGNFSDPRVQEIIERTSIDIRLRGKCRYNDNLDCAWGIVRDLFGLALIPLPKRSQTVQEAIDVGVNFLLSEFDLLQADYPHIAKIHPTWFKLSFPLFYQADVIFVLRVMRELGKLEHPGAQKPLGWLQDKAGKNGRWRGGSPYKSRTWPITSGDDTVNHWITLQALQILSN